MITEVEGIRVGHWTDLEGLTGCTVVLCPPETVGSCEVRGGAPGTRETDALRPGTMVNEVHAVVLTGGSAFGLAAADGVARWLEERGVGYDTRVARVPIVAAAVLFDLAVGDAAARPGPEQGYAACEAAADRVDEGTVGAGTGATVAKLPHPDQAMKGGVGSAAVREGDLVVGAIAAANSLGFVVDDDGEPIAANRSGLPATAPPEIWGPGTATTLVVVATNAALTKERAHLLSLAAHEGLADAVRPSHTMWDGDTAFALATGRVEAGQRAVEALARRAVAESIRRAVRTATGVPGFPSVSELGEVDGQ
ncbi:MAG: P1 family peptidase [Actinomycetota bacterium]|nr:P1 family peptidase [Actinomycetota bacterium]